MFLDGFKYLTKCKFVGECENRIDQSEEAKVEHNGNTKKVKNAKDYQQIKKRIKKE